MLEIDIKHVAKLARLRIEDEKVEMFQRQMGDIIAMVERLPEIESRVLPVDRANRMELRKDEIKPSLRRDVILANAPETAAGCVVVPKTTES